MHKVVAYYRVSTASQGRSGLGLDAQRELVSQHVQRTGARIVAEFVETESGRKNDRPELAKALDACRLYGAVLTIAKLDRLSRNAGFLLTLQESGVKFVAADMPAANDMTIGIMAVMARHEAQMIRDRTRDALASIKRKIEREGSHITRSGRTITKLGRDDLDPRTGGHRKATGALVRKADDRAAMVFPAIQRAQKAGCASLREIAARLNADGVQTARGGEWTAMGVKRVLDREAG